MTCILLDLFPLKASRISLVPDTEPVQLSARLVVTLQRTHQQNPNTNPSGSVGTIFCRSRRLTGVFVITSVIISEISHRCYKSVV